VIEEREVTRLIPGKEKGGTMHTPLQITTRRHPLAIAVYLLVATLGLLFIVRGVHSNALFATISPFWVYVWEWSMLIGGVIATAGVLWPRRLDRGLFLESSGAAISMFGMITYTSAVVYIAGWRSPGWVLLGFLAVGLGLRAIGAARDLGKVETAAMTPLETFHLPADPGIDHK
jgi:hypothetical protein